MKGTGSVQVEGYYLGYYAPYGGVEWMITPKSGPVGPVSISTLNRFSSHLNGAVSFVTRL